MSSMKDAMTVKEQYQSADHLNTRLRFQGRYSVNRYGFNQWVFDQYRFEKGDQILEVGCGTGTLWPSAVTALPEGCQLTLTDFSEGMLKTAVQNLNGAQGVAFRQADIQQLPFPDQSMDVVIANMMLYHVPDLGRALDEVRRVLKPSGTFYSATYGENGLLHYIGELFAPYGVITSQNDGFTLQNGQETLKKVFAGVEKREYEDRFEVTEIGDLIDYLMSMSAMIDFGSLTRYEVERVLKGQMVDGAIHIPKEYGMFISRG